MKPEVQRFGKMGRMEVIFEGLRRRIPSPNIIDVLDARHTFGTERDLRARNLEKHVAQIVSTLPNIESAIVTMPKSKADRKGRDIVVQLQKGAYPNLDSVFVQVKSSNIGVMGFRDELKIRHHLSWREIPQWLIENKLVLINGSLSREQISQTFESQLQSIVIRHQQVTPKS